MAKKSERIAKVIAASGLCSRRQAEQYIADGQVTLDGQSIQSPAINVAPSQTITVNGVPLNKETFKTRLWCYYKPNGLLTTHNDPQGRPTVFNALPPHLPRVVSVGRLDINSEGLLLLTNDGELSRLLELPKSQLKRQYRVRVRGKIDPSHLQQLKKGVTIDGMTYAPIDAFIDNQQTSNAWLTFVLTEGKNREIRRICSHFGWSVNRLIRTHYGLFELASMKPGQLQEIPFHRIEKQKSLCALPMGS